MYSQSDIKLLVYYLAICVYKLFIKDQFSMSIVLIVQLTELNSNTVLKENATLCIYFYIQACISSQMHMSVSAAFSVMVPIRYRYANMQPIYSYSANQSDYWWTVQLPETRLLDHVHASGKAFSRSSLTVDTGYCIASTYHYTHSSLLHFLFTPAGEKDNISSSHEFYSLQ